MKFASSGMISRLLTLALVSILFLTVRTPSTASSSEDSSEASRAVVPWLLQIDSAHYEESYAAAGQALHEKVGEDKWTLILKTERGPMGKTLSRDPVRADYHANGFEGKDGEFYMFTFNTSFEKFPKEIERVVVRREDGKWMCVGYNFGPREFTPHDADADSSTTVTTVTTTASGAPVPEQTPKSGTPAKK